MAKASVATDFHQSTDVAVNLASKVAFNLKFAVDDFSQSANFGFGEFANLLARVNARL